MAEWKVLTDVPQDNELYQKLDQIKAQSDSIFTVVTTALEIAQTVLGLVQSLLIDISNPILILVQQIIEILEDLQRDLKNAGVYVRIDKDLPRVLEKPHLFDGGYQAFEDRLIQSLQNSLDPTRPDFSTNSTLFQVTLYGQAGIGNITRIVNALIKFFSLFGGVEPQKPSPPVGIKTLYYRQEEEGNRAEVSGSEVSLDNQPTGVRVKWSLPRPAVPSPFFPSVVAPPPAYLIAISSRSKPILLGYNYEIPSSTGVEETQRSTGIILSQWDRNTPLPSNLSPTIEYGGVIYDGAPPTPAGQTRVYGLSSRVAVDTIPLNALNEETKIFTYHPSTIGTFFDGYDFHLDIPFDDLPSSVYDYETRGLVDAEGYSVQLFTYTADLIGSDGDVLVEKLLSFDPTQRAPGLFVTLSGDGVLSTPSRIRKFRKPLQTELGYISALREAFTLFLLGRLDLDLLNIYSTPNPFLPPERQKILKLCDLTLPVLLAFFKKTPEDFRGEIRAIVDRAVSKVVEDGLPDKAAIETLSETIEALNSLSPSPYAELESEDPNGFIQPSGQNMGGQGDNTRELLRLYVDPIFYDAIRASNSLRSAITPVGLNFDEDFEGIPFEDALFLDEEPTTALLREYYSEVIPSLPLMFSSLPVEQETIGDWIDFKFFSKGIPLIDDFLSDLVKFMKDLEKSMQGIIAAIRRYIALLSQRVAEIQAIILRIKRLIDLILSFRFPAGLFALSSVSAGTSGLVGDILSSEEKPLSGSGIYGTGATLVFGGLPTIALEFLQALAQDS